MATIIPPFPDQYDQYGRKILPPMSTPVPNMTLIPQQQQMPIIPPMQATQPQPDFSPIPIRPAASLPAEQSMNEMQVPQRNDPQFKGSKLNTILAAIAGGFGGAAGGPKAGIEVADAIKNSKYNQAMEQFTNKMNLLKDQQKAQNEPINRAEKEVSLGVQRGVAQAGANYKTGELERKNKETDIKAKGADSLIEHRKALDNYNKWKQDNPKLDDLQYVLSLEGDEQKNALDMLKQVKTANQKPLDQIEEEAEARATGTNKAAVTPLGKEAALTKPMAGVVAQASDTAITGAQKKAEATTTGRINIMGSDLGIKYAKDLATARSEANTLTSNIKDTRAAATSGLEHLPKIYSQIDQMEKDGKLGAIMSKWSDFMAGTVGTDPEASRLRFNIGLMDTLLAKVHGGARGGGSPAMMHHFENLLSSKKMDGPTLRATLKEAEDWLQTYQHSGTSEPIVDKPKLQIQWGK